jgi:hypothetical protein
MAKMNLSTRTLLAVGITMMAVEAARILLGLTAILSTRLVGFISVGLGASIVIETLVIALLSRISSTPKIMRSFANAALPGLWIVAYYFTGGARAVAVSLGIYFVILNAIELFGARSRSTAKISTAVQQSGGVTMACNELCTCEACQGYDDAVEALVAAEASPDDLQDPVRRFVLARTRMVKAHEEDEAVEPPLV